jgi:hypothetical protein
MALSCQAATASSCEYEFSQLICNAHASGAAGRAYLVARVSCAPECELACLAIGIEEITAAYGDVSMAFEAFCTIVTFALHI